MKRKEDMRSVFVRLWRACSENPRSRRQVIRYKNFNLVLDYGYSVGSCGVAGVEYMRKGKLWLIGRVGILICFGVMPIVRIRQQVKWAEFNRYSDNCHQAYLSNDLAGVRYWASKTESEYQRLTRDEK